MDDDNDGGGKQGGGDSDGGGGKRKNGDLPLCNLGDNWGASPLNSLNLSSVSSRSKATTDEQTEMRQI